MTSVLRPNWRSMVFRLYDIVLFLAAFILAPYGLLKGLRYGNLWRGFGERFGLYKSERLQSLQGRKVIWVHAVSVGETRASIPLLRELRKQFPDSAIVLSSLTYTGRMTADEIEEADLCIFLPYDLSFIVQHALKQIKPDVVLLVETEIWPNFIRKLYELNIPVMMVNGRISDKSFPRYWLIRPLLQPLLKMFTRFCMQSRQDELRIIRLGAASKQVTITGNLKFDLPAPDFSVAEVTEHKKKYRLPDGVPVWVAGSTRQGEEELILDAYSTLLNAGLKLILVLVPRYPDRAKPISELIGKRNFSCRLRSEIDSSSSQLKTGEILVGDTLGEMLKFYSCADLVFVGGSLVPIGGHNILEASLMNKPVIFGPYMQNFKAISKLLIATGGGRQVEKGTLAETVKELMENDDERRDMGALGGKLFAEHSGATVRTVELVGQILGGRV
ncbi:MAG: 3-deoxy-D-manno-octulosonic acid transferase [Desulfuromonas sp.]|nr:MAG: 3-deoxy-D-manno-octulosonic acid transferase [Desulfuromonas sp.]